MLRGKILEEEQRREKEPKPPLSLKELREQRRLQEEKDGNRDTKRNIGDDPK